MAMSRRDDLYRSRETRPGSFRFDEQVVDVFPDMIDRSVPGYSLIVPMIGQLARRYVQPGTTVHDLGCSLGAVTLSVRSALLDDPTRADVRLVATDNAPAMVRRLADLLGRSAVPHRVSGEGVPAENRCAPGDALTVELVAGDIRDAAILDASMVVLNFTLQFLNLDDRDRLLAKVAAGLCPGGVLVLAEKVRFEDRETQTRQTEWHHDYKRLQGYSDLEIARKRTALESVLVSETEQDHRDRLLRCGFRRVTRWFQCFGFCAWLAER
jgi:tRNA (cmo5U34)-methyltransferase